MKQESMDVTYVAQLARLHLSEDEIHQFQSQLTDVLKYVEQLGELQLDGIAPTAHATPRVNVFRPDQIEESLAPDEAVRNAPLSSQHLFIAPKVVE